MDYNLDLGSSSYSFTYKSSDLRKGYWLVADPDNYDYSINYTYTGSAASLALGPKILVALPTPYGQIVGYDVDFALGISGGILASPCPFSLIGFDATSSFSHAYLLNAESTSYSYSIEYSYVGSDVKFIYDPGAYPGVYNLTGLWAEGGNWPLSLDSAEYSLVSSDADLKATRGMPLYPNEFSTAGSECIGWIKGFYLPGQLGDGIYDLEALTTHLDDTETGIYYVGRADPGSLTSAPKWQIRKVTFLGNDIMVQYANNGFFTQVWDNRLSLVYG